MPRVYEEFRETTHCVVPRDAECLSSWGSEDLIIQPRVRARTSLVPRTILIRKTILEETDDDPIMEHKRSAMEDENERFWTARLDDFLASPSAR